MNEQTELLREMRDLLLVMAEPALAKRDEKLRAELQAIVGKSKLRANAVFLMDGARSQTAIINESGIDPGQLSRFVKALREASLLGKEENPKLVIVIPPNFFEQPGGKNNGK
jgi:hypothetical protein